MIGENMKKKLKGNNKKERIENMHKNKIQKRRKKTNKRKTDLDSSHSFCIRSVQLSMLNDVTMMFRISPSISQVKA